MILARTAFLALAATLCAASLTSKPMSLAPVEHTAVPGDAAPPNAAERISTSEQTHRYQFDEWEASAHRPSPAIEYSHSNSDTYTPSAEEILIQRDLITLEHLTGGMFDQPLSKENWKKAGYPVEEHSIVVGNDDMLDQSDWLDYRRFKREIGTKDHLNREDCARIGCAAIFEGTDGGGDKIDLAKWMDYNRKLRSRR